MLLFIQIIHLLMLIFFSKFKKIYNIQIYNILVTNKFA